MREGEASSRAGGIAGRPARRPADSEAALAQVGIRPGRYIYDVVWTFEQAGAQTREKGRGRTVFVAHPARAVSGRVLQDVVHKGITQPDDDEEILRFSWQGSSVFLTAIVLKQRTIDGSWSQYAYRAVEAFPYFLSPTSPEEWAGVLRRGDTREFFSGRRDGPEAIRIHGHLVRAIRSTLGRGYERELSPDDQLNTHVYTHWSDAESGVMPLAFEFRQPGEVVGISVANVWKGVLVHAPGSIETKERLR